jgi:hypothetical protein
LAILLPQLPSAEMTSVHHHTQHLTPIDFETRERVKYGLRVMVICQCMCISSSKCTILVQEEPIGLWEQRVSGNSLYFPFHLSLNL